MYSSRPYQSPCSGWNFGNVPVYPGLADASSSPDDVASAMSAWNQSCHIAGGFIWLYDDFYDNLALARM